jgi:hypothetical protein
MAHVQMVELAETSFFGEPHPLVHNKTPTAVNKMKATWMEMARVYRIAAPSDKVETDASEPDACPRPSHGYFGSSAFIFSRYFSGFFRSSFSQAGQQRNTVCSLTVTKGGITWLVESICRP